jgi:ATP-dependent RNA helicase RhlE
MIDNETVLEKPATHLSFDRLGLIEPLLRAVKAEGYEQPTSIQEQAIPLVLSGRDVLGCAQTGTGKTAVFALPILQRLAAQRPAAAGSDRAGHVPQGQRGPAAVRPLRALIIVPTRELAAQVDQSFEAYGRFTDLRHTVIYGGVRQRSQVEALKRGVDVLTATPGRLLDLIGQRIVQLKHIEVLVLDEADRMLDMGFIIDIRKIVSHLPKARQTLFFSATMPPTIQALADSILTNPVEIRVTPEAPAAETVEHRLYFVERHQKLALLLHLLEGEIVTRALVFTRTKIGADRLEMRLKQAKVRTAVIHADRSQEERETALRHFKQGKVRILVASDIAARGLDIDDISHVVNYDLPPDPDTYVHRIGRTGRAGATGVALSFCDFSERPYLKPIEQLIRVPMQVMTDHPYVGSMPKSHRPAAAAAATGDPAVPGSPAAPAAPARPSLLPGRVRSSRRRGRR